MGPLVVMNAVSGSSHARLCGVQTGVSKLSWPRELALAAVTGVVTAALPVHRLPRGVRWTAHAGLGLAAAGAVAWTMHHPEDRPNATPDCSTSDPAEPDSVPGTATTLGVEAAAGLVTAATSAGGTALDHAIERRLADRGVRRPRWWIGAAASLVSVAGGVLERRPAREFGVSATR